MRYKAYLNEDSNSEDWATTIGFLGHSLYSLIDDKVEDRWTKPFFVLLDFLAFIRVLILGNSDLVHIPGDWFQFGKSGKLGPLLPLGFHKSEDIFTRPICF